MRALCKWSLVLCLLLAPAVGPALAADGPDAPGTESGSWTERILDVGFANVPLLNWLFGGAEPAGEAGDAIEPWGVSPASGGSESRGGPEPWGVDDPSGSDTELTSTETEDPSSGTTENRGGPTPWG